MKQYETPVAEILLFAAEDIITTSDGMNYDPAVETPEMSFMNNDPAMSSDWAS